MKKLTQNNSGEVVCAFCGIILKNITTVGKKTIYSECKKGCKRNR